MSDADVIVVGAGVAGLAAAVDLVKAGLSVICLEARDRIGGRILSRHDPLRPLPVELGAEFVHGSPPEIIDMAASAGLLLCDTGGESLSYRDGSWISGSEGNEEIDALLADVDSYSGPDMSWSVFISNSRHSDAAKREATRFVEGFNAAHADRISLLSIQQDQRASREIDEGKQFRFPKGYDQVPHYLASFLQPPRASIRLNSIMSKLNWRRGHVSVGIRERSRRLSARACILTLPVGVWQSYAGPEPLVEFTPRLSGKFEAAQQIASGDVFRVVLEFSQRIWEANPSLVDAGFLFTEEEVFPTWWASTPLRAPIITGWSAGRHTEALCGRSAEEIASKALAAFARVLRIDGTEVESKLLAWHLHDWHADPFSRGAYSYAMTGHLDARAELAAPLEDTLFFAGEATETNGHSGTVHGAIATGRRAAQEAIAALR